MGSFLYPHQSEMMKFKYVQLLIHSLGIAVREIFKKSEYVMSFTRISATTPNVTEPGPWDT